MSDLLPVQDLMPVAGCDGYRYNCAATDPAKGAPSCEIECPTELNMTLAEALEEG